MQIWQSEQINELVGAIVTAQSKLVPAKKEANNPFFNKKYADLPSVWDATKPFRDHGIAIIQCPAEAPLGHVALETLLAHESGQWMRSRLVMPLAKQDPQGVGSAITYARRYALGCMTGLVTEEDDDGNAASHQPTQHKQTAQAKINELRQEPAKKPSDILKQSETTDEPWRVPFGKSKGKSAAQLEDGDLEWVLNYYRDKYQKEPSSRYAGEWEQAIEVLQIEMDGRLSVKMEGV